MQAIGNVDSLDRKMDFLSQALGGTMRECVTTSTISYCHACPDTVFLLAGAHKAEEAAQEELAELRAMRASGMSDEAYEKLCQKLGYLRGEP